MIKDVKVNTFQKSFDTRRRDIAFIVHQGHLIKYLTNRYQWHMNPKMNKVARFPLHVDIETTAKCNLRCPMCPNRHVPKERQQTYDHMDFSLFTNIVDECARNNIFSIRLSWRGEVLTNPRFSEYIYYAKIKKKIPNVSFLTNGTLLNKNLMEQFIDYGLDYISISIDGLDDIYEQIRYPLRFEKIYNNLKLFKELKQQKKSKKPVIRITALWPAIARDPQAFYKRMMPLSDKIVYNPLKDHRITEPQREDFICQFPWERLFVAFNGDVQPCSNIKEQFVIGNVRKDSLQEIWHGTAMQELRRIHRSGKRMAMFPCSACSYGIDYSSVWSQRDWSRWNPQELCPQEKAISDVDRKSAINKIICVDNGNR